MDLQNNTLLLVVFSVLAFSAAVQLFYYLYFYLAVYLHKAKEKAVSPQPVSIIICARNEAENLSRFLPSVLEQDYPDYEVIVVNDCSEDNSYDVLGKYLVKYPHLKISTVNKDPKFTHNKKFAQFIGIKAAKNDILLFTDADCQPESDKWLAGMTSNFTGNVGFVLGYGGFRKAKGLLNKYIRYDTSAIAMQYLGMAIRKLPYMGVGRNLAYLRPLFFRNKGFGAHNHIVSGDDDLFVNSNATGLNTAVEFTAETHTRSVAATTLKQWITQKKRHLTTAPYYKLRDKILLIAEPLTRVSFYSALIILLSFSFLWPYVLAIAGVRLIFQIIVYNCVQKKLNEPGMVIYSLIFDIFSPVVNILLFLGSGRNRSVNSRWK